MNKKLLFLILMMSTEVSFSQAPIDKFIGTWDGFGYVDDNLNHIVEGCMQRLVIEKIPNRTDSVACSTIYVPTNAGQSIPSIVEVNTFNLAVRDGYLVCNFSHSEGATSEYRVSFILDGGESRIYSNHSLTNKGSRKGSYWFPSEEYLYTKSNYAQKPNSFFKAYEDCCARRTSQIPLTSGPESNRDEYLRDQLNHKAKVKCLPQNVNVSSYKMSYRPGLNLVAIEVQGLTPMYFRVANREDGLRIIGSKNVKFDFKEIDVSFPSSDLGYIVPRNADIFFEDIDLFIQYPAPDFLMLSWKDDYANYIRGANSKITKKTK